jgi:hypothetical protein
MQVSMKELREALPQTENDKLPLVIFNGSEPSEFLLRLELRFKSLRESISDSRKISFALSSITGSAFKWVSHLEETNGITNDVVGF